MLKKARLLTRPSLARQDAPWPRQGRRRIETGGVPSGVRWGFWWTENAAGGLFQYPASRQDHAAL